MKFTEKLKELRESKGLTQRQIASALDIDVAVYNRFEKGERHMKREFISKLAIIYDIPVEKLTKFWLAGQVYSLLYEENMAQEVICMVAEDIPEYGIKNESTQYNHHQI